jgi:hypothetical protein
VKKNHSEQRENGIAESSCRHNEAVVRPTQNRHIAHHETIYVDKDDE